MRLIDADVMIKKICGKKCGCTRKECGDDICEPVAMVYEVPTAYDLDKVVEQLEDEREYSYADFEEYVNEKSPCLDAEYDDFFHRGLERAIKIVKEGGKDEFS